MNPTSQDIKDMLLEESSLGLSFGDNLNIGRQPSKPDNCVTIFDMASGKPQLTYTQGEDYFYEHIQIWIRNNSYVTGYALADDIRELLHGRAHETYNSTYYSLITCTLSPFCSGFDDNNRVIFIINFEIQRR